MIQACGSQNLLSLHAVLYEKYLRYQMLVLTYRGQEAVEEHRKRPSPHACGLLTFCELGWHDPGSDADSGLNSCCGS
ncbi:hypothetical protein [Phaeobacter sp. 22II1-1F12B]|uniref:hypothetical protein n=1 Tax=Rhodobacterales TaxID=204455 RepID=UPI0035123777